MISTRDLSQLPDVDDLRRLLQSMAMLDAVLSPEWEYRYYSFNSQWASGEQMGSMRNGCGDDFFALFNEAGCFLKGFAHEAAISPYRQHLPQVWPGAIEAVPRVFAAGLSEPAFRPQDVTFCIWREYGSAEGRRGPAELPEGSDPDGSEFLLSPLDGRPETYHEWAEGYYEQRIALGAVRQVCQHRPLTTAVAGLLNPELSLADLAGEIGEIGYPR